MTICRRIFVLFAIFHVAVTWADDGLRALIAEGLAVYEQAQSSRQRSERLAGFKRAQQLFRQAIDEGAQTAELYTNMGTAALQAERLGAAILAFRQALLLNPQDRRAMQNLAHTRSLLPAWVPRPESHLFDSFFHYNWPLGQRSGIAAMGFFIAMLAIALATRWRWWIFRTLAVIALTVWLVLLISITLSWAADEPREAVISIDGVLGRAADSPYAPLRFSQPLPEGTEIRVLEVRGRWANIALANNRQAWVLRSGFELIAPEADRAD